jgi:hypothetical protein
MGDQADYGAAMRADRQDRHARWRDENLAVLRASGMKFKERPTSVLFREQGKPRVDFYPHTGRWRVVGVWDSRTYSGGARAFLAWYGKQGAPCP